MNAIWKFLIEFFLTFILIYLIYYFFTIRKKKCYDPANVPVEVGLLLLKYKIDMKKVNYRKMILLISIIFSFNIALVVTLLSWYMHNAYLIIFISLVGLLPLTLLSFHFIGRHFEKISLSK